MERKNNYMKINDEVGWTWGSGIAVGIILDISYERTVIISKGKEIVRKGSKEDPAITIKHKNGNLVIKLAHELQKINN